MALIQFRRWLWSIIPHRHKWHEIKGMADPQGYTPVFRGCNRCGEEIYGWIFPGEGITLEPGESIRVIIPIDGPRVPGWSQERNP